jgi:uncharacterized protein
LQTDIFNMPKSAAKNAGRLKEYFTDLKSAVIAFSGGVDSSVLAKTAYDALGKKALAVTIDSPTVDKTELACAKKVAKAIGIKHVILKHDEVENEAFRKNEPDRCYHCKKGILGLLKGYAKERGYEYVVEGTNAEEILGHRPGYKAVKEEGTLSPLAQLGLKKKEIRELAEYLKLPNAQKPSTACLASRIPYGTGITQELLEKVAKAEKIVWSIGVKQLRVRCFGDTAVIETLPEDFPKIARNGKKLAEKLKKLGFLRVTLDLEGYSTGSLNR